EKGYRCKHNDALEELYPIMLKADGIIVLSPVYIGSVSGQTRMFWDRMRPIMEEWTSKPRFSQLVIIGGSRLGSQERVIPQVRDMLNTTWHVPLSDPAYSGGINAWSGYRFKRIESQYGSGLEGVMEDEKAIQSLKEVTRRMIQAVRIFREGQKKLGKI
ncbi:MAG: flavodoxin family protein, partial [Candidatus Ranarchaeia archaeon]